MEKKSKLEGIWQDPRFSHLVNDPRYKQLPKNERKVKIDNRFKSMFEDDKFRVKYTVDKYGRRVNKTTSEDLKKYYDLNSSEEENEQIRKEEVQITKPVSGDIGSESDGENENDALEIGTEMVSKDIIKKLNESNIDYARGEGCLLTDSSSDEETSTDDDGEVLIEHVWGELDNDAPKTDESTYRLAACNMDWDRIQALDIMVLCNSFLPPGHSIVKVSIYPSEFGKARMAEEEINGPPELTKGNTRNKGNREHSQSEGDSSDDELVKEQDSDAEEGDEYHMEKLREYQLNRLKYYYAVIECDSVSTADKIYQECDGIEYESTATKLDLRFIPDDMTFDDDPKDICTELPDLNKYKPRTFTTTALQQAKVELTWDETNVERKEINDKLLSGKLAEVSDVELRKYVAYSSEEDDEEASGNSAKDVSSTNDKKREKINSKNDNDIVDDSDEGSGQDDCKPKDAISKYKALLNEINKTEQEKEKMKYDVEYTWGINVDSKNKEKFDKGLENATPFERILEKKRLKKKKRKEEIKDRLKANDSDSSSDLPDGIDLNDQYFAEEFVNGDFETPKQSNKSKKKNSKIKKMYNADSDNTSDNAEKKTKELELLLDDDVNEENVQHFFLKKIQDSENLTKSKRKRRKLLKKSKQEIEAKKAEIEDKFQINVNDERFKALYTSHLFNIDPTDSHFKKTKGMEAIIGEKLKRHKSTDKGTSHSSKDNYSSEPKRSRKSIENSILVKNIQRKIQLKRNNNS